MLKTFMLSAETSVYEQLGWEWEYKKIKNICFLYWAQFKDNSSTYVAFVSEQVTSQSIHPSIMLIFEREM